MSRPRDAGRDASVARAGWYLETVDESGALRRYWIRALPFRIGRRQGLDLHLALDSVSKLHAEIYEAGSGLRVRDLGSRNGTFLNRAPVDDAALGEGDVLHFADFEFRLSRSDAPGGAPVAPAEEGPTTAVSRGPRHGQFEKGTRELRDLLRERQVTMVFQPIILLSRGTIAGYEALGRGRHPQLDEGPLDLLRIAETMNAEAELSRLFRRMAVELIMKRTDLPPSFRNRTIFLNTHRAEFLRYPGLMESLDELREIAPDLDLALEIHESVLTSLSVITELRTWLAERNFALAYDDFGAGRSRLHELTEAPPHYLKFDQRWVKDLDHAAAGKRRLLRSLLRFAAEDLHAKTVAEGIETEAEKRACTEVGFTYGQGFHIGRPQTIDEI